MATAQKVDYQRYLASREWRVKRKEVIERAGGWCERCHSESIANVHHLTYARLGDELDEDLLGVCRPCHQYLSAELEDDPAAQAVLTSLENNGMVLDILHGWFLGWHTKPFPSGYSCHVQVEQSPDRQGHEDILGTIVLKLPGANVWLHCSWY